RGQGRSAQSARRNAARRRARRGGARSRSRRTGTGGGSYLTQSQQTSAVGKASVSKPNLRWGYDIFDGPRGGAVDAPDATHIVKFSLGRMIEKTPPCGSTRPAIRPGGESIRNSSVAPSPTAWSAVASTSSTAK